MDLKEAVRHHIGRAEQSAVELSHRIHAHPEIGFEEVRASHWVGDALSEAGFMVNPDVAGMPTALVATAGSGPLVIGICAEYDALPGIGHACGHNVIAGAAVAAASGLAPSPMISESRSRCSEPPPRRTGAARYACSRPGCSTAPTPR